MFRTYCKCFKQLTDEERQYGYFQNDGATSRTENRTVRALCEVFSERIISTVVWAPKSPKVSVCDFYLCGNLKQKVYLKYPCIAEALQKIWNVIASVKACEL
jgi:hypothetical protein